MHCFVSMALRLMQIHRILYSGHSSAQLSVANSVRGFSSSHSSKSPMPTLLSRPVASSFSNHAFRGDPHRIPRLFSVPALRHFSSDAGASAIKICNPFFHSLFRYAFEEPRIMCSFLNAILDFKQDQLIQSIEYLPQESPSFYPSSPPSYQLFNLRCHSNRYILQSLHISFFAKQFSGRFSFEMQGGAPQHDKPIRYR